MRWLRPAAFDYGKKLAANGRCYGSHTSERKILLPTGTVLMLADRRTIVTMKNKNMNKNFKSGLTKLKLWFAVHLNDWPVYRVTYTNGEITYPLHYREAKGCADVWNGKLWIDWQYADKLINQT